MSPTGSVGVIWPDGVLQTADNWDELEDVVRTAQYDIPSKADFRDHMATRAKRWSGTEIQTSGTADDFFWELERAGLLRRTAFVGRKVASGQREPYIVDLEIWRNANKTADPFAESEGK